MSWEGERSCELGGEKYHITLYILCVVCIFGCVVVCACTCTVYMYCICGVCICVYCMCVSIIVVCVCVCYQFATQLQCKPLQWCVLGTINCDS